MAVMPTWHETRSRPVGLARRTALTPEGTGYVDIETVGIDLLERARLTELQRTYDAVRQLVDRTRRSLAQHQKLVAHAQKHVAASRQQIDHVRSPVRTTISHRTRTDEARDALQLADSVADFARTLAGDPDMADVLLHLVEHITEWFRITGAAVVVLEEDDLRVAVAGDTLVATLEEVQKEQGAGPGVDSSQQDRTITVSDMRRSEEATAWGRFTDHALNVGMRAVAAVPLTVGGEPAGSLHLYSKQRHDWSRQDMALARAFGDIAMSRLQHLYELNEQRRLAEQLQGALDSRVVIEQAKGVLAESRGIDVDDAFKILRTYARTNGLRLHDVARDIVSRQLQL